MALETGTYVNDLVITNPTSQDPKSQGDDHLRLIKTVLKDSFSGISGGILIGGTDTGTANSYVMTNSPSMTKYSNFLTLLLKIANSNTGASVINVDGLGSVSITRPDGSATQANDLRAGQVVVLSYISGAFQLVAAAAASIASANNVAGGSAGAILNQFGPGATQFLTLGSANQIVGVNNGATGIENKTLSVVSPLAIANTAGAISLSVKSFPEMMVNDTEPAGTQGAVPTAGYNQRVLNTVLYNTIPGASLASNTVTLPAGTYFIEASAPAYICSSHKLALYNATASTYLLTGTSEQSTISQNVTTRSFVRGRITLSVTSNIYLNHYIPNAGGFYLGAAVGGLNEVYAEMKITQVL